MNFPTAALSEAQEANLRDLARFLTCSSTCQSSENELFAALSDLVLDKGEPLMVAKPLRSVAHQLETFPPLLRATTELARIVSGLLRLSDAAFAIVEDGRVPVEQASKVGEVRLPLESREDFQLKTMNAMAEGETQDVINKIASDMVRPRPSARRERWYGTKAHFDKPAADVSVSHDVVAADDETSAALSAHQARAAHSDRPAGQKIRAPLSVYEKHQGEVKEQTRSWATRTQDVEWAKKNGYASRHVRDVLRPRFKAKLKPKDRKEFEKPGARK